MIDIGQPPDGEIPCLVNDEGRWGHWAALSYCWGKPQGLKATIANLEDLQTTIPVEELPRTLRDATTVTRELGLRYLWIDRLCILQDSREGWEEQSGRMSHIFRDAYVTLAASAASDVNGSLHLERDEFANTPQLVEIQGEDGTTKRWWLQPERKA